MKLPDVAMLQKKSKRLEGNGPGVYFLFHDEELVYVGKSWNCLLRVAEHTRKETNKVFDSWSYYPTDYDEDLLELEKELIGLHRPKYNIQHKGS
jgi:excinuclease UvrABC nuclease subunit